MVYINLNYKGTPKFNLGRFCEYSEGLYDTLTSYFLEGLEQLEPKGYFTITSDVEGRPDLISYKLYNNTQYWWIILHYNTLYDPSELVSGKAIKFPDLIDIENLYLSLKAEQVKNDKI